jgi:acyl-CoA reductase-like NAD-dependent aldehyde dehydrogenase
MAGSANKQLVAAQTITNEEFPDTRIASPVLLEVDGSQEKVFEKELFGPIAIVVKTRNTADSIRLAKQLAQKHGAISCGAYTTDAALMEQIADEMASVFVPVSFNLTGPIYLNQHAAFSDFHVTGGNPAGNASFTDPNYINRRFVWVGQRYA